MMTAGVIVCYWAFGLAGAIVANEAFRHMDRRILGKAKPISRGLAIVPVLVGLLGPMCWLAAMIWWLAELADSKRGWLSKPIFGGKEQ
jgi:hypothetical protein